jgi:glutathione S-transferase
VLKVWGKTSVANVQKVMWCLGELGIPYQHAERNPDRGDPSERAYLTLKGAAVVPMIEEEDGFVLWEGNAIVRYLAEKHGRGTLWPEDPRVRADADRWMDYQLSTARVHIHPLMRECPDAEQVAYHSRMLAEAMGVLEPVLGAQDYLAGDRFTMADIPLGIVAYRWIVLDIARPRMPNVEAWYDRLSARSAFRAHVIPPEDPFTPLRTGAGAQ